MRIIRARFENFRLLRDLELEFTISGNEKLTVIRAENDSGKTTILNGLQWGFYGDEGLPDRGRDYRLHPIDWDNANGKSVRISVEIDFETVVARRGPNRSLVETTEAYRIIRSVHENLQGKEWNREASTVRLFHLGDEGSRAIDHPESQINEELPPELREVFFTDGDRALSFIEAATRTKRDRVERAIRSLLGLDIIEDALRHVKRAASDVNKQAKSFTDSDTITQIASRLEAISVQSVELESKIIDSREQSGAFEQRSVDIQKKIDEALTKGNREQLVAERERTQRQLQRIKEQLTGASREHSLLLKGLPLARDLLAPVLEQSFIKLTELREQGKIPNSTIPVLEECLQNTVCICGESLAEHDVGARHRISHIRSIIEESRKATELQSTLTDLHFGSSLFQTNQISKENSWVFEYRRVSDLRENLQSLHDEQAGKLKSLELQIDQIPDTDVQGLRDTQRGYRAQREKFNDDRVRYETHLATLLLQEKRLTKHRDKLLRDQEKGAQILAELNVAQDVMNVLQTSYQRITSEELEKVSTAMNGLFLEMIGSDPEQGAIIQKAWISESFDIIVYGPNNRTLNPDRDLNGASRRALTLAFILALTKVSEVEAPNAIDTPLGMMSGYVKRSVLRTAIRESSQLILFLTRAEIADCEEILDETAARVITLTNPAHYPRILENDPGISERKVLRCDCNHREECELCRRRVDALVPV
jgi:DNA sulfur modification protein DndD